MRKGPARRQLVLPLATPQQNQVSKLKLHWDPALVRLCLEELEARLSTLLKIISSQEEVAKPVLLVGRRTRPPILIQQGAHIRPKQRKGWCLPCAKVR
jgi:hypothetical protein